MRVVDDVVPDILLTAAVEDGLRETERVRAAPPGLFARLVDRARTEGLSCDAREAGCAARIGAAGGIDFVIVGVVDLDGAARGKLQLVDCATGETVRTVEAALGSAPRDWPAGLMELAGAAVDDGVVLGVVEVPAPLGAVVIVDGVPRGPAPLRLSLPVGRHRVGVKGGAVVDVDVPAAAVLAVRLQRSPGDEPLGRRLALGAIVVGAMITIGGGVGAAVVALDGDESGGAVVIAGRGLSLLGVGAGVALLGAGAGVWWLEEP